ncbi:hypothetical protein CEXT_293831 [Caerostris extrusa]|uniref:Uncharacterized protein n=1 Tax=Caerostris extrusa TaxID=172846 RepID=A0AAV4MDZ5_CAEEX|nr:hypothetical protein CEXT_293831 [Caerostris extrusa]
MVLYMQSTFVRKQRRNATVRPLEERCPHPKSAKGIARETCYLQQQPFRGHMVTNALLGEDSFFESEAIGHNIVVGTCASENGSRYQCKTTEL